MIRSRLYIRYVPNREFLYNLAAPVLLTAILCTLQHIDSRNVFQTDLKLLSRGEETKCAIDPQTQNTCDFVRTHCADFADDGLIPYLDIYYCAFETTRPFLLTCMCIWFVVLFSAMAMIAGEYLSIHLAVIVRNIGISQNLAGVTIFAFGNGSSDLFSTLAAMNSNSGSLAINELFGAAAFITSVVLGFVAICQPFTVDTNAFIGDVVWFIVAASMLTAFLADGELVLMECVGIICLYVAFVCFAVSRSTPSVSSRSSSSSSIEVTTEPEQVNEETRLLPPDETSTTMDESDRNDTDSVSPSNVQAAEVTSNQLSISDTISSSFMNEPGPNSSPSGKLTWMSFRELFGNILYQIYPMLSSWHDQTNSERSLMLASLPLLVPAGITIPRPILDQQTSATDTEMPNRYLGLFPFLRDSATLVLQLLLAPQFLVAVVLFQSGAIEFTRSKVSFSASTALCITILLICLFAKASKQASGRYVNMLSSIFSFLSFSVSLTWIYLIATTAVSLLETLGLILEIPDAILGSIIFAVGNSSNDLFANIAVAKRGLPILAASACFGGPMMNTLLGIGLGGLIQILKEQARGISHGVYKFEISPALFVSVGNLLLSLSVTLIYAFCNSWVLDKRLGLVLISLWGTFTAINIALSVSAGI